MKFWVRHWGIPITSILSRQICENLPVPDHYCRNYGVRTLDRLASYAPGCSELKLKKWSQWIIALDSHITHTCYLSILLNHSTWNSNCDNVTGKYDKNQQHHRTVLMHIAKLLSRQRWLTLVLPRTDPERDGDRFPSATLLKLREHD